MKRLILVFFCGLLGVLLAGEAVPRQANGQSEIPTLKLVIALRSLNTAEASYEAENGRFADREQMLAYLRQQGFRSKPSSIDPEKPEPYALTITTSSDGMHYQITLQRPSDMNDKSTWCKTAAFSDDQGLIFLGQVIGCTPETENF